MSEYGKPGWMQPTKSAGSSHECPVRTCHPEAGAARRGTSQPQLSFLGVSVPQLAIERSLAVCAARDDNATYEVSDFQELPHNYASRNSLLRTRSDEVQNYAISLPPSSTRQCFRESNQLGRDLFDALADFRILQLVVFKRILGGTHKARGIMTQRKSSIRLLAKAITDM